MGLDVVNRKIQDDPDPFLEADERMEFEGLIEKTGDGTVDEFLNGDSDLPVCVEMDDNNWNTTFIEELGNDDEDCGEVDGDIDDEDSADQEEPLPKLKIYKEAITALEDVS